MRDPARALPVRSIMSCPILSCHGKHNIMDTATFDFLSLVHATPGDCMLCFIILYSVFPASMCLLTPLGARTSNVTSGFVLSCCRDCISRKCGWMCDALSEQKSAQIKQTSHSNTIMKDANLHTDCAGWPHPEKPSACAWTRYLHFPLHMICGQHRYTLSRHSCTHMCILQ